MRQDRGENRSSFRSAFPRCSRRPLERAMPGGSLPHAVAVFPPATYFIALDPRTQRSTGFVTRLLRAYRASRRDFSIELLRVKSGPTLPITQLVALCWPRCRAANAGGILPRSRCCARPARFHCSTSSLRSFSDFEPRTQPCPFHPPTADQSATA